MPRARHLRTRPPGWYWPGPRARCRLERRRRSATSQALLCNGRTHAATTTISVLKAATTRFVAKFTFNQMPTVRPTATRPPRPGVSGNVITDNTGAGVDSDPDADPLTASVLVSPLHGSLTLNANGGLHIYALRHRQGPTSPRRTAHLPDQRRARAATASPSSALRWTPDATTRRRCTRCPAHRPWPTFRRFVLAGQPQPHPGSRRLLHNAVQVTLHGDQRHAHAERHRRPELHRRHRHRPTPR